MIIAGCIVKGSWEAWAVTVFMSLLAIYVLLFAVFPNWMKRFAPKRSIEKPNWGERHPRVTGTVAFILFAWFVSKGVHAIHAGDCPPERRFVTVHCRTMAWAGQITVEIRRWHHSLMREPLQIGDVVRILRTPDTESAGCARSGWDLLRMDNAIGVRG